MRRSPRMWASAPPVARFRRLGSHRTDHVAPDSLSPSPTTIRDRRLPGKCEAGGQPLSGADCKPRATDPGRAGVEYGHERRERARGPGGGTLRHPRTEEVIEPLILHPKPKRRP